MEEYCPDEEEMAEACRYDDAERLRVDEALLDLTGVTSHRSFDEVEKERWTQGIEMSAKLAGGETHMASESLAQCHSFVTVAQCQGCQKTVKFWNRCDLFYCPQCSPRLSKMRLDGLMQWVESLKSPKHLVLTFQNVPILTKEYIHQCKAALGKFRRTKLFRSVKGGLWALEITNKEHGWHLHFHLVIESPFLPVREVSATWKKVNGGKGEVVWIEDASRGGLKANLPRYVTKYTGKGFRPHEWSAEKLRQFVVAMSGCRAFGVFGNLLGQRKAWREWLKTFRQSRRVCECGCSEKKYFSELEWQWKQQFTGWSGSDKPRPPTKIETQFMWRLFSQI